MHTQSYGQLHVNVRVTDITGHVCHLQESSRNCTQTFKNTVGSSNWCNNTGITGFSHSFGLQPGRTGAWPDPELRPPLSQHHESRSSLAALMLLEKRTKRNNRTRKNWLAASQAAEGEKSAPSCLSMSCLKEEVFNPRPGWTWWGDQVVLSPWLCYSLTEVTKPYRDNHNRLKKKNSLKYLWIRNTRVWKYIATFFVPLFCRCGL